MDAVNRRLRSAKVGIVVRQKGNRFYLRATLPPKPNSTNCLSTNLQRDSREQQELLWRERFYNPALKWLPEHREIDAASALISVAQRTKPNSRSRQMACHVLQRFAKFAGVEVDLKPYVGSSSPKKVNQEVPADDVILASTFGNHFL